MEQSKRCEVCGQLKPVEDFSKSYKNRCKECVASMARIYVLSKQYDVWHLALKEFIG